MALMKNLSRTAKAILLLIPYLIFVIIMFSAGIMMFVDIDHCEMYFAISSFGFVGFVVFLILIECFSKDYRLKYYFLGRGFRKQKNAYFSTHQNHSKKEKRDIVKNMKHEYRRHGNISITLYCITETPNKIWHDENHAFNYFNALDEQKINYIVGYLYLNCEDGGGYYRFFEELASEPFSYAEFELLIKNSSLFSKKLKSSILKKKHKAVYEAFKSESLSEKESALLDDFDSNESYALFDHQTELFDLVEKLSLKLYFNLKQKENLPDNTVNAFISKDKTKRVCIYLDTKTNAYKINRSTFFFYDTDLSPMNSEGAWAFGDNSSYFETAELALNEIKTEIADFDEIKLY